MINKTICVRRKSRDDYRPATLCHKIVVKIIIRGKWNFEFLLTDHKSEGLEVSSLSVFAPRIVNQSAHQG